MEKEIIMNSIDKRIKFLSSAIRENHIEEYRLRKELKQLLEEFENEIQKITMLEVQPLGPKSINRDKDN